jgi:hypothetical protein
MILFNIQKNRTWVWARARAWTFVSIWTKAKVWFASKTRSETGIKCWVWAETRFKRNQIL